MKTTEAEARQINAETTLKEAQARSIGGGRENAMAQRRSDHQVRLVYM